MRPIIGVGLLQSIQFVGRLPVNSKKISILSWLISLSQVRHFGSDIKLSGGIEPLDSYPLFNVTALEVPRGNTEQNDQREMSPPKAVTIYRVRGFV